jgi:hypothetical protein
MRPTGCSRDCEGAVDGEAEGSAGRAWPCITCIVVGDELWELARNNGGRELRILVPLMKETRGVDA